MFIFMVNAPVLDVRNTFKNKFIPMLYLTPAWQLGSYYVVQPCVIALVLVRASLLYISARDGASSDIFFRHNRPTKEKAIK